MPDDTQMPAQTKRQELANMRFDEALDYYTPQLADALPDHIPLNRFKRVVITAVNTVPELARADRLSLFNSCVKCALDGLVPDGREAALVVYETSVKSINDRGMEQWRKVDLVQYMPMVAGIRKRMRNSGAVLDAAAEVVCRNDKFHYRLGDDAAIEHEPPPLDQDRGEMVGAYSIIKLKNGEVLREVMRASEIEQIMRTFAKGYDKPRSPWQRTPGEMWRKTVLRRNSKRAPSDSELDRLLGRDDEALEIPDARDLPAIPPRPTRLPPMSDEGGWIGTAPLPTVKAAWDVSPSLGPDNTDGTMPSGNGPMPDEEEEPVNDPPAAPLWVVTLPEGELWEYDNPDEAAAKLTEAIEGVATADAMDALWDDNEDLIEKRLSPEAVASLRRASRIQIEELIKKKAMPEKIPVSDRLGTNPEPIPTSGEGRAIPRRRGPQAGEAAAPPQAAPEPEMPPTAAAEPIRDPNLPPDRPQARIEVPNDPRGKPDYRAWALVKFMPVARRSQSDAELAQLMGDYADQIEAYKLTLTPMYRKAFDDDIAALFAKLPSV